jgi:hypothetical protein
MRGRWWQWWGKRSKFGLYECVLQPEYKRFHWWSVRPMFTFSLFTFLRTVLQSGIAMIGSTLCIRRFRSVFDCVKKILKYEFDDLLLRNVHASWKCCWIGFSLGIRLMLERNIFLQMIQKYARPLLKSTIRVYKHSANINLAQNLSLEFALINPNHHYKSRPKCFLTNLSQNLLCLIDSIMMVLLSLSRLR